MSEVEIGRPGFATEMRSESTGQVLSDGHSSSTPVPKCVAQLRFDANRAKILLLPSLFNSFINTRRPKKLHV